MDQGFIRRLAVLSKDYLVLAQINDFFIYSGGDHSWPRETSEPTQGSVRLQRFYEWVEGIRKHAPTRSEAILAKVAAQIADCEKIPEKDRNLIRAELEIVSKPTVGQIPPPSSHY